MKLHTPDRGDVVWLNFTPQAGREQSGRRPALIISPKSYNRKVGLAIACPITSHAKGYPFEVAIDGIKTLTGVVLADHVRSVDWRSREATMIGRVTEETIVDVLAKLNVLVG